MTGSRLNGDTDMSKRGRITLEPEAGVEPTPETETTPLPEDKPDIQNRFDTAHDNISKTSHFPPGGLMTTGNLIKVVAAGLAVVSLVLLWKNRRL